MVLLAGNYQVKQSDINKNGVNQINSNAIQNLEKDRIIESTDPPSHKEPAGPPLSLSITG